MEQCMQHFFETCQICSTGFYMSIYVLFIQVSPDPIYLVVPRLGVVVFRPEVGEEASRGPSSKHIAVAKAPSQQPRGRPAPRAA